MVSVARTLGSDMTANSLNQHPKFAEFLEDWQTMRHCYRGERVIKDEGDTYLKPTSGMIQDGYSSQSVTSTKTPGRAAYEAYKDRAIFPDYVKMAVEAYIGLLWTNPPTIELPAKLEPLRDRASVKGEGLELFLRRIHEQQLVAGRCGILADLPQQADPMNPTALPYLSLYNAETIINWDEGTDPSQPRALNLVVLNETQPVRVDSFSWHTKPRWRVLWLGDLNADEMAGAYWVGTIDDVNASSIPVNPVSPSYQGKTLTRIPFVFVNDKDIIAEPNDPPLLGLARTCLAIYRGEADYRQNLYMQGQDTLVVIGNVLEGEDGQPIRTGAGGRIDLPLQGDAKYIGVNSQGLAEQKEALENLRKEAATKAGQLIDNTSRAQESGDALQTRVAAQTTTLKQISLAGAAGLERILKTIAEWVGANPDEVKVEANTSFCEDGISPTELKDLQTAKTLGLPISRESVHNVLVQRKWTNKTYDEELKAIEEEDPLLGMPIVPKEPAAGGGNGGAGGQGSGTGSGGAKRVGARGA